MDSTGGRFHFDAVPAREDAEEEIRVCPRKPAKGSTIDCVGCVARPPGLCSTLKPEALAALGGMGRTIFAPARTILFEQGRKTDFVSILITGALRLEQFLPDGRRQIVGFALAGDFLDLALAPTHNFNAVALTPVKICQFPRVAFSELADAQPHLLKQLMGLASQEMTLAQEHMVTLGRRSAEEKIAAFLIGMRDRHARLDGQRVHVQLPMHRLDIGDFLGMTVETVSRTMTRLAREKVIVIVPDGVRLLDLPRLERIACTV
jgi:CRP/FNR family transcriptional regulator